MRAGDGHRLGRFDLHGCLLLSAAAFKSQAHIAKNDIAKRVFSPAFDRCRCLVYSCGDHIVDCDICGRVARLERKMERGGDMLRGNVRDQNIFQDTLGGIPGPGWRLMAASMLLRVPEVRCGCRPGP